MTVADLQNALLIKTAYEGMNLSKTVTGCYTGDMLSSVLKHAKPGNVWLTVVNNPNTVAVAMLRGLSCIIMCEGVKPTADALKAALEKKIPILLTNKTAYQLAVEIGKVI